MLKCRIAEVKLSEGQRRAIQQAANAPVMVLTGGPGCGKTFATATVVKLWRAMGRGANKVALCAPTGAQRLCCVTLVYIAFQRATQRPDTLAACLVDQPQQDANIA